ELEIVAMRAAAWRARAAVSDPPEVVDALSRTAQNGIACRHAFWQFRDGRGNIVHHPVYPDAGRRVGVVADQRQALRPLRNAAPFQGWGDVVAVARVFRG